jgi:EEF1A N-terminal glycine/lysine methyltransferase
LATVRYGCAKERLFVSKCAADTRQGHLLWNAAQVITTYIEDNRDKYVQGKTVLELGAGAGLPSLACAARGATTVVATDYPDPDLVANLQYNVDNCGLTSIPGTIAAKGYLWGNSTVDIKSNLPDGADGFDLIILADILFNHSEHRKLVRTLVECLCRRRGSAALVFFTPYRPWLLDKDLAFFEIAHQAGFVVNKVLEHTMDKVMFDKDPGDELLRRTVFGYTVTWPEPESEP